MPIQVFFDVVHWVDGGDVLIYKDLLLESEACVCAVTYMQAHGIKPVTRTPTGTWLINARESIYIWPHDKEGWFVQLPE